MATIRLYDIAHARAGDKGETTNIGVFPYREEHYATLARYLTAERVSSHFAYMNLDSVTRYEVPNIGGLNFVLVGTRRGGVSAALDLDSHGKSLSFVLLALELEVGEGFVTTLPR